MKKHYSCLSICIVLLLQMINNQFVLAQPLPLYTSRQKATLKTLQQQIEKKSATKLPASHSSGQSAGTPFIWYNGEWPGFFAGWSRRTG